MIQPTIISLHSNEYNQEFHYDPFAVKFNRCVGSFNILNVLSSKICLPNKTEDLDIHVFNMIKGKNVNVNANVNVNLMKENVIQIKGGIMINVDVDAKNIYVKKIIFGILLYVVEKIFSKYY